VKKKQFFGTYWNVCCQKKTIKKSSNVNVTVEGANFVMVFGVKEYQKSFGRSLAWSRMESHYIFFGAGVLSGFGTLARLDYSTVKARK
jgi:hypothetical protein